jgi:hypothetical protein
VEGKNPFENREPRTEPADLQLERIAHCTTERQFIARELIAGRLTLHEAIDRFRILSQNNPDYSWTLFQAAHPGATDDERLGHQVISYVKSELSDHPELAAEIVARLEGQLYTTEGKSGGASRPPSQSKRLEDKRRKGDRVGTGYFIAIEER